MATKIIGRWRSDGKRFKARLRIQSTEIKDDSKMVVLFIDGKITSITADGIEVLPSLVLSGQINL